LNYDEQESGGKKKNVGKGVCAGKAVSPNPPDGKKNASTSDKRGGKKKEGFNSYGNKCTRRRNTSWGEKKKKTVSFWEV